MLNKNKMFSKKMAYSIPCIHKVSHDKLRKLYFIFFKLDINCHSLSNLSRGNAHEA